MEEQQRDERAIVVAEREDGREIMSPEAPHEVSIIRPVASPAEVLAAWQQFQELKRSLLTHWRPLHDRLADELDRRTVVAQLEAIQETSGAATARAARAYPGMACAWGVARGLLERNPMTGLKPLTAARALDLRGPLTPAPATAAVVAALRAHVPGPGPDRHLGPEIDAAHTFVTTGAALAAAETVTKALS